MDLHLENNWIKKEISKQMQEHLHVGLFDPWPSPRGCPSHIFETKTIPDSGFNIPIPRSGHEPCSAGSKANSPTTKLLCVSFVRD
ncbi:hypothetical protein CEXT_303961 [Caerostris extrusa]|uniref:Ycf15 n=1 Tax=Caerostris extrusa TaxID=172846 RepID=A0AAV4PBS3_CAEEX|nr:hypothetical protein CEXT_303961 [Caerostris extrusa]